MPNIENFSRFAAVDLPSLTKDGHSVLVVCVAGRFALPGAGNPSRTVPMPTDEQPLPIMEDIYSGKPGSSSLRFEGQTAYYRPGTDIYLTGQACAPRGRRTESMLVDIRVGNCRKQLLVLGNRTWTRGLIGARLSPPEPFESMPLIYERAFGGAVEPSDGKPPLWEPRNPVGCGLYSSVRQAVDKPVPNIEDPGNRISSIGDRPAPQGLGPIARSWQPRVVYAGTYDQPWVEERAPLWPVNFDERFFCAASTGLTTQRHLTGGEPVSLAGVSPRGSYEFPLPTVRLRVKGIFRDRQERRMMVLDAVHLEPDEGVFTMIWRAALPTGGGLKTHEVTIVRELESWERDAS